MHISIYFVILDRLLPYIIRFNLDISVLFNHVNVLYEILYMLLSNSWIC